MIVDSDEILDRYLRPEKLEKTSDTTSSNKQESSTETDSKAVENGNPKEEETLVPLFKEWQTLEFETSVELLAFFDGDINNGVIVLHPWQITISEKICKAKSNSLHPYKYALCAANGSGKDAFVIAPFAIWLILCRKRSRVIITSSSGVQLTNQTEAYIRGLAEKVNVWSLQIYGVPIIKIRKRHIVCTLSGSEIILFATDEEGKAEGYHPIEPNAEMAIICNEAKSIPPYIFRALRRCTGYNYWIDVSTPGEPLGDFYKHFNDWPNKIRVTFFDCPHQSKEEFDADKKEYGEYSPFFRSKWLALFTFIGGKYVINQENLEKLRKRAYIESISIIGDDLRVGLDIALSTNGDETVVSKWKGNKQIKQICLRIKDAVLLSEVLNKHFIDEGITKSTPIYADDGGVGRAVIDILRRKRWNIVRILNQSAAKNKKHYRNRGAELWDKFNRLVVEGVIVPLEDEKLYSQLASRKFKESEAGIDKLCLQSKKEMIAEGLPSPDRADAAILAFTGVKVEDFLDRVIEESQEKKDSAKMSIEEVEELLESRGTTVGSGRRGGGKKIYNSLSATMKRYDRTKNADKVL